MTEMIVVGPKALTARFAHTTRLGRSYENPLIASIPSDRLGHVLVVANDRGDYMRTNL